MTAHTRDGILQSVARPSHNFIAPPIARDRELLRTIRARWHRLISRRTDAGVLDESPSPLPDAADSHDEQQPASVPPLFLHAGELVRQALDAAHRYRVTVTLQDNVPREFYLTGALAMVTLRAHCLFENPQTVCIEPSDGEGESCDLRLNTSGEETHDV